MKLLPTLALVITLAGCASSSVLVGKSRPPIDPSQVKLYLSPPAQFEEVALVDASSAQSFSFTDQGKMDKVIERLKVEAAKLGANGILLRSAGEKYGGAVTTGSATASGNSAFGTGIAVPVFHKAGSGVAIFVVKE